MTSCRFCNKEYFGRSAKKNVLIHEKYCDKNINREFYICDVCGLSFDKRHSLIAHKKYCGKPPQSRQKPSKVEKIHKCKYCNLEFENGLKLGGHVTHCVETPNYSENLKKIKNNLSFVNKKHSDESKKKISEARIKYLSENPDKVPYLLNHSSKESYPEKYFTILFKKEQIIVEKSFRIGLYELDFCILDKKIDIEIDGNQHYFDTKIIESDIKRTKYLEKDGWDIIRINWANYQKMTFEEKSNYIKELKNYINNLIDVKPTITFTSIKKGFILCECGEQKYKTSKRCEKCRKLNDRKGKRPTYEQLIQEIQETNYSVVGRKYGVSGNSIKKWIKYYEKNDK